MFVMLAGSGLRQARFCRSHFCHGVTVGSSNARLLKVTHGCSHASLYISFPGFNTRSLPSMATRGGLLSKLMYDKRSMSLVVDCNSVNGSRDRSCMIVIEV